MWTVSSGQYSCTRRGSDGRASSCGKSAGESRRTTPRLAVPRRGLTTTARPWRSANARTAGSSGASAKRGVAMRAPETIWFMVSLSRNRASSVGAWPTQPRRSRMMDAVSRSPSLRARSRAGGPKRARSSVTARQTAAVSSVAGTTRAAAASADTESRAGRVVLRSLWRQRGRLRWARCGERAGGRGRRRRVWRCRGGCSRRGRRCAGALDQTYRRYERGRRRRRGRTLPVLDPVRLRVRSFHRGPALVCS